MRLPLVAFLLLAVVGACTAGGSSPSVPASVAASPSPSPSADPSPSSVVASPSSAASPAPIAWSEVKVTGDRPAAREDHTWTVGPDGLTAYLFGGRDGRRTFADLWAFDLGAGTWRQLDPGGAAPAGRFGHEALWVDGTGLVVFAGQADASTFFDDLWAYDPEADRWTELPARGDVPVARYGTCSALDPEGRLWISHGFTEDRARFADTKVYDFAAGRWQDATPGGRVPVERCLHGCWWTPTGELVLYAGQTTGVEALGDLWALSGPGSAGAAWGQQDVTLPPERNLYAYARRGDDVWVIGGRGEGRFRRDVWRFAGGLAPEKVAVANDPPIGRSGGTLTWDEGGGRFVLVGGKDGTGALGDMWALGPP